MFHDLPSCSITFHHFVMARFSIIFLPTAKKHGLCSDVQVKNSVPGRTWRCGSKVGGKPEETHSGGRWQRGWILIIIIIIIRRLSGWIIIIIIIIIRRLSGWWFGTMEFHDFPETVGNGNIIPTDFNSIIFQRGRYTTNQNKKAFFRFSLVLISSAWGSEPLLVDDYRGYTTQCTGDYHGALWKILLSSQYQRTT